MADEPRASDRSGDDEGGEPDDPPTAHVDLVGEFVVQPTLLRFGAAGDYLVQVDRETRAELGRSAVLVPAGLGPLIKPRPVVARVALNVQVAPGYVHVDQTLRDAMLVRVGDTVSLYRIPDEAWWRVLLDEVFKPKRLWLYAYRSFPRDMEKDLCGLNADTTAILGLERRDRVRVEAVRWDAVTRRYTVNSATPSVFELSSADAEYTRREVGRDFGAGSSARSELGAQDVFRVDDRGRPRLPFVRLDADIGRMVANTDLANRRNAQEGLPAGKDYGSAQDDLVGVPDRLSLLAPVRLSVSLPHAVMARAAYHGLNAGIGILAAVIAAAEISLPVGALVGILSLAVVLPLSVIFDVRRKVH